MTTILQSLCTGNDTSVYAVRGEVRPHSYFNAPIVSVCGNDEHLDVTDVPEAALPQKYTHVDGPNAFIQHRGQDGKTHIVRHKPGQTYASNASFLPANAKRRVVARSHGSSRQVSHAVKAAFFVLCAANDAGTTGITLIDLRAKCVPMGIDRGMYYLISQLVEAGCIRWQTGLRGIEVTQSAAAVLAEMHNREVLELRHNG